MSSLRYGSILIAVLFSCVPVIRSADAPAKAQQEHPVLATGNTAAHRGVWELRLRDTESEKLSPFGSPFQVRFTRPDASTVMVDGFCEGKGEFRARAYCDLPGEWRWHTSSSVELLDGKSGRFTVLPSKLPGKLRLHPEDPHQFAYDDGSWFLHIGDTGYRCLTDTEPQWQAYLDQAVRMGATKIRTWFCRSRGNVEALLSPSRKQLNLP